MKLPIGIALIILLPLLGTADVAGDWAGVLNFARKPLHIVLHVTGPDTALKATVDSPDQNGYRAPVRSITLSGSTLQFTIPYSEVTFSGDVNDNGTIVGTFVQRGNALPLVLERVAASTGVTSAPAGVFENGHYRHTVTGVEFDVPSGWALAQPGARDGDPREMVVLREPTHKAIFASVNMTNVDTYPDNISAALSKAIPALIARRTGLTGAGAPHVEQAYKIRPGSVEKTLIGGQQALRAVGESEQGSGKLVELLTWIYTEHTRTFFFLKTQEENFPALQMSFEQMIQSAKIP